ncbi:MAG: methylated-DNA--[protein]-cysteine S-methyltransferase [Planctomycetales bacterium]|nr:methylated-DNA--[protein]-cysteine S-methyltransferase [Planctomycetales bacterium]
MITEQLVPSPVGPLRIAATDRAVVAVEFAGRVSRGNDARRGPNAVTRRAARELADYFAGRRARFSVPLDPAGTPWQRRVWAALRRIPHGETVTYGALAARAGSPGAARAIGGAVGSNPIAVLIPCHRVVASDGLGGFGGGLARKRALLAIESARR